MQYLQIKTSKLNLRNLNKLFDNIFCVIYLMLIESIRQTTGIKLLYTTIATVTMNLIVSAAIVLLNLYITVYISY